jgi:hypothetical protein
MIVLFRSILLHKGQPMEVSLCTLGDAFQKGHFVLAPRESRGRILGRN